MTISFFFHDMRSNTFTQIFCASLPVKVLFSIFHLIVPKKQINGYIGTAFSQEISSRNLHTVLTYKFQLILMSTLIYWICWLVSYAYNFLYLNHSSAFCFCIIALYEIYAVSTTFFLNFVSCN